MIPHTLLSVAQASDWAGTSVRIGHDEGNKCCAHLVDGAHAEALVVVTARLLLRDTASEWAWLDWADD